MQSVTVWVHTRKISTYLHKFSKSSSGNKLYDAFKLIVLSALFVLVYVYSLLLQFLYIVLVYQ
jgi:hypothetical protein